VSADMTLPHHKRNWSADGKFVTLLKQVGQAWHPPADYLEVTNDRC
jgi:hypothetical protein